MQRLTLHTCMLPAWRRCPLLWGVRYSCKVPPVQVFALLRLKIAAAAVVDQ